MNHWLISAGLGVAILCVATSSILVRYTTAPALAIAFYRLLFTALLALILGRIRPIQRLRSLSRHDQKLLLAAGVALALHFAAWISSLSYTSVASSVLFTNLQVVFVIVIAWVGLRERVSKLSLVGIISTLIGSFIIARADFYGGRLFGDILALLSGIFIALALIIARKVRVSLDLWSYTTAVSFAGALVLFTINMLAGTRLAGYGAREMTLFLLMALVPGIGGHGLFNWALRYVKAPIVSVTVLGETIGASLLAWLLFNEAVTGNQIIGGIAVLVGIGLAIRGEDF